MKKLITMALAAMMSVNVWAQRATDKLDRGLVAIKTNSGVFCSWRILGEEYYDVKYNIYRDGSKLNDEPISVSNFTDKSGAAGSTYTVSAVVRGKEQPQSKSVSVWAQNYMEITPDHGSLTSTYVPNDACMADVDGDGELEILMKFDNLSEINASYPKNGYNGEYSIAEVFKLDGTKLWWLDFGPNMGDFQNNEQNIVAYDWDQDGKAEAIIRAADGTTIHMANGETYVVGDATKNYRGATGGGANWFMHDGAEYLVYMNGATGEPYQVMDYPLKRLENGETDLNAAWGDGYGHRSTKHFFGAPYLDGRKASIFLARGIYTRHKMIAYDVDSATHKLIERWRWNNNTPGSAWYGQGYHNYSIADVDWDGRDEICFGSMVIDDNGHGLSTTGLGHGDAQHHGDFNPYIHGHEIYACNEDNPDNNDRDATTSKIYYRQTSGNDDGRAMMGNFSNKYPGCLGRSGHDTAISSVTNEHIPADIAFDVNFRIYWDGDLLEETFNGTGTRNSTGRIYKPSTGETIATLQGSLTNNDTKATPCYQGDILGDWREEVIMRTSDNKIRIYSTTIPTEWRNYTLWHDHQYRNAMVWQMCGYNQPPHVSYFIGELEGITMAPPALTTTNRTEVANGGTIDGSMNDKEMMMAETGNMTVSGADGAKPYIFFDNAPSWVQGHDNNDKIEYATYTHTLTGGAFSGDMRLVKQGDGTLILPNVTQTYTGSTDVWAGVLCFDGTMQNSRVWLNRFAELNSNGGKFMKGIQMDYASILRPGGKDNKGMIETDSLILNFGSRIVFDALADGTSDAVKANVLTIEQKDWQYGQEYSTPVFEIASQGQLAAGKYLLIEAAKIEGDVNNIVLEGIDGVKSSLTNEDGKIYLNVEAIREATSITWDGGSDGIWDFAHTENFKLEDGNKDFFVTGDAVTFDDNTTQTAVVIKEDVSPKSVVFANDEKDYTLMGEGSIIGDASLTLSGAKNLTIMNTNKMTGGVVIENGKLTVSTLANADGTEYGALGGTSNLITLRNGGTLAVNANVVSSQKLSLEAGGGCIYTSQGKTLTANAAISQTTKTSLTKTGNGTLQIGSTVKLDTMYINQGIVHGGEVNNVHQYPSLIVLNGGTLKDPDNIYSYSTNRANIEVPADKTATWTLDARCDYSGKLTGEGNLTVNVTSVRSNMTGDWSKFKGTLKIQYTKTGSYDPALQWNNSYGLPNATLTGVFNNNGKDITIGTLSDQTTLSGNGRYTVKHIAGKITKSRSGLKSSYAEVQSTLIISEDVTVTFSGSTKLKAGDTVQLWKANSFQATSNIEVTLPELPEGLYWDTTNLLTKEGRLTVTDVPSGINGVKMDTNQDDTIYNLNGMKVSGPLKKGIYIKNGKKIVIK